MTIQVKMINPTFCLPPFPKRALPWLTQTSIGKDLLWLTYKASRMRLAVFIGGESGTGKELLARLIHAWSDRAQGPFVPVNCGALPVSIAESELFGHCKGAFTGAYKPRVGALLQAHGGTLFLDEIGDLSPDLQVKFLRFFESGEIQPIGSDHRVHANVRIVCATHRPLSQLVADGKFRLDLYYRLASVAIEVPPLRERIDDIDLLGQQFAGEFGRTLSSQAILRLRTHSWPGNVRELRHCIERACGMVGVERRTLIEKDFDFLVSKENVKLQPEIYMEPGIQTLEEMKGFMISRALRVSKGNRRKAAQLLGVARSTLFEMIRRHRIMDPTLRNQKIDKINL